MVEETKTGIEFIDKVPADDADFMFAHMTEEVRTKVYADLGWEMQDYRGEDIKFSRNTYKRGKGWKM